MQDIDTRTRALSSLHTIEYLIDSTPFMKIVLHETIQLTNMLRADSVVLVVGQSDESIITKSIQCRLLKKVEIRNIQQKLC